LFIEYTKGDPSLFRIDIEIDRPEYERDGNGFVLDSEICAYYCIDFINCLKSWVNRPDRADIMDRQIKPCEPILNKGFEDVNLIRQYSANNPFSLLYYSILECYKVIQKYYPEFIPKEQKTKTIKPKLPTHLTCNLTHEELTTLYIGLTTHGFLDDTKPKSHFYAVFGNEPIPEEDQPFTPLIWTATKRTAKNEPHKRSLLDLLKILGIPENEIKDKPLINSLFKVKNAKKFRSQDYTKITDSTPKRHLIEFTSDYHSDLYDIVEYSKKQLEP
jgi:hypothetical protein